jgi:hypothetical protein
MNAEVAGKVRDTGRPLGASEWRRRCRKGHDDFVDLLPLATLEEREQQEWNATDTSSVTGRSRR